jgi:hypothetical protein
VGYYHHELENFPGYISYFEFDGDGGCAWRCLICQELSEETGELHEWFTELEDGTNLVDILRRFDNHVEEYHC